MTENKSLFDFKTVPHAAEGVMDTTSTEQSSSLKACVDELFQLVNNSEVASKLSQWPRVRLQCRSLQDVTKRGPLDASSKEWQVPSAWKWWKGYSENSSTLSASASKTTEAPSPADSGADMVVEMVSCKKLATYLPEDAIGERGAIRGARAFYIAPSPQMVLCSDRLASYEEKREVLTHELTHAFDVRAPMVHPAAYAASSGCPGVMAICGWCACACAAAEHRAEDGA